MQRITNCIIPYDGRILMIKKPRRGWWYPPGGKMESEELVTEAVEREVYEETGLTIKAPELRGVLTHLVTDGDSYTEKRTMFLFHAASFTGNAKLQSKEGELSWMKIEDLPELDMDEADRLVIQTILEEDGMIYGTFTYDTYKKLQHKKVERNGKRIR
ncbi:NUDIX hydrolase [Alkalicoccus urumqiensis]|uniref:NUDIX hydrolase n=1 Tax=Alkalicoccus urumqiensis TaxID=1548213 RepID=A0A2P6MH33_ALKUR|nr:8-oxo-dGTP diphosphatase [Alkalicoccus urumqiensis]PRO65583.1 NUDIX hydrolase [Alkalicoccus urumqiensis]